MKKLLLASALAALAVSAQASTDLYGKAGLWMVYSDDGDNTETSMENRSSRLGVKGSEALTANTNLTYQLEYALKIDDGSQQFTSRNTFIGFENDAIGSVKAGRHTTIDDNVDFSNPTDYNGTNAAFNEGRWNDTIVYATPEMSGMQFLAQTTVDDNAGAGEGSYGVAGKYEAGSLHIGASFFDIKGSNVDTAVRVSAAYDINQLTLSGLYQNTDFNASGSETENAFTVAAAYDIANSPWDVYAQFDSSDNVGGTKDAEQTDISVGGNYGFTDATKGSLYLGITDNGSDDDTMAFGAGIVHSF